MIYEFFFGGGGKKEKGALPQAGEAPWTVGYNTPKRPATFIPIFFRNVRASTTIAMCGRLLTSIKVEKRQKWYSNSTRLSVCLFVRHMLILCPNN